LETLLPLSLALVHKGRMGLNELLACLTAKPAELLGLPLGRLAKGAPADLVLFDPDRPWQIDPDEFRSKSKNSPFDDAPVQGRALRTVVAGRPLFTFNNVTAAVA
jgi:dihydroorotase